MGKIIRWPGLLAFLILVIGIGLVGMLVVDGLVERGIEKTGTRAVGARVELAAVDVSLFPAGLTVSGMQVTNPDRPMRNAVDIERLTMNLDTSELFRRKLIIEEMGIAGLRFDTARKKSGAVKKRARVEVKEKEKVSAGERVKERFRMPQLAPPDVEKILAHETLKSEEQARALEKNIKTEKKRWQERLQELPDKEKLKQYQERLKRLKEKGGGWSEVLGSAGEASGIYKDIKQDLARLREAKQELEVTRNDLKKQMQDLSQAPAEDIQRLKKKYALTPEGVSNISRLIFGDKVYRLTQKAVRWYERLQPVAARLSRSAEKKEKPPKARRHEGVYVHFKEARPLPGFLVKNINAEVMLSAGTLAGVVNNVTFSPQILGNPMEMAFTGKDMEKAAAVSLNATVDHVDPDRPVSRGLLQIEDYPVNELMLSREEAFPLMLRSAMADGRMNFTYKKESLDATIDLNMNKAQLDLAAGDDPGGVKKELQTVLAEVASFDVRIDLTGSLSNPDIAVSSGLDKVVRNSLQKVAARAAARFEKRLREAVSAKIGDRIKALKGRLTSLNNMEEELTRRLEIARQLTQKKGTGSLFGSQ